jgi:hypothetical protein
MRSALARAVAKLGRAYFSTAVGSFIVARKTGPPKSYENRREDYKEESAVLTLELRALKDGPLRSYGPEAPALCEGREGPATIES